MKKSDIIIGIILTILFSSCVDNNKYYLGDDGISRPKTEMHLYMDYLEINYDNGTNIDAIFNFCVDALYGLSNITGFSYESINVIIFVFLFPGLIFILTIIVIYLLIKIKKKNARILHFTKYLRL